MKTQEGGKYIYEGSYGCAFNPALPCAKTGQRKGMGKLFNNIIDFKTEQKIQKFIKKIDPDYEATVPFYGSCRADLENTRKADQVTKCNIVNEHSVSKKSLNQLMFKFGGTDLDVVMNNIKSANSKYNNFNFDTLITSLLPLVKCIVKISKYGYLHSDIKPPNILYNIKNKKLYLIDFGLLQKQYALTQSNSTLSFKYLYYPPEFITIKNLRSGIRDSERLYNDILENFGFYNYEVFMDYLVFANYEVRVKEFITYAISIPLEQLEKEFLNKYIKTLDIYSLGMSIIEFMYITHIDNTFNITNKELYDSFIKNILIKMIDPDPRYRLTPEEAYMRINCLYRINKIKVKEDDILNFIKSDQLKQIAKKLKLPLINDKLMMYNSIIKNPYLLIK